MASGMRYRTGPGNASYVASFYDDPLASDYDSDVNFGPVPSYSKPGIGRQHGFRQSMDPKAAEFNQYLMSDSRQQSTTAAASSYTAATQGLTGTSDDEDYYQPTVGTGGLTRSRSCILGPNSSEGKSKRDSNSNKFTASNEGTSGMSGKRK